MAKNTERYEVVAGTRSNPGTVLKTFLPGTYRCGGPATACLAWYRRHADKAGAGKMFFRRVTGDGGREPRGLVVGLSATAAFTPNP